MGEMATAEQFIKAKRKMDYYINAKAKSPQYSPVDYPIGRVYAFGSLTNDDVYFTKNPKLDLKQVGPFICEFFNGRVTTLRYYQNNVFQRIDVNDLSKTTHNVLR